MLRTGWVCLLACLALTVRVAQAQELEEGFVKTPDGVELYYVKAGSGEETVILPSRLFAFEGFRWLAGRYTLIAYDMRNRGRSSRVEELEKISIEADVADLETVRRHFGVRRFHTIGYSYLGLMVALYALEHPERVDRIVQVGAVPLKFGTQYKPQYMTGDAREVLEQRGVARLRELRAENYHQTHPREYCEREWQVSRYLLVGDPAKVDRLGPGVCDMPNEWPVNLARHMQQHFAGSVQKLDVPRERIRGLKAPVLVVHGTRDRNAPYGAGREWAYLLPDARLLTVPGAAHQCFAEEPELVRAAIAAFLAGRWPAAAEQVTVDPRLPE